MKTAIICYSYTQNNLLLAGDIVTKTGGTLLPIEEPTKRTKLTIFLDLFFGRVPTIREYLHLDDRFDHYILISPIWGGKIASPLRAFLQKERSKIKSYSFISICGGSKDQTPAIEKELTSLLRCKPVTVAQLSLIELCNNHLADLAHYRIDKDDLEYFQDQIHAFVTTVTKASAPVVVA